MTGQRWACGCVTQVDGRRMMVLRCHRECVTAVLERAKGRAAGLRVTMAPPPEHPPEIKLEAAR